MTEYRPVVIVVPVLFGIAVVAAVILVWSSRRGLGPTDLAPPDSPCRRLAVLARQRPDYRILVGIPPSQPERWAVVSQITDEDAQVQGHGHVLLREVKAFVVAYPNGQVVDYELAGLHAPAGMTGLSSGQKKQHDVLHSGDLKEGRNFIEVKYGRSALRPNDRGHYSTTLTNISRQKVRVLRFAGYTQTPEGWMLNTVTGTFYSAREFREWYGLAETEWIGPGESVADPNNYGGPPVLWAYSCQAEDGKEFIAGGILE